jgi:hypothetical protein
MLERTRWHLEVAKDGWCYFDYVQVDGLPYCGHSNHTEAFPALMEVSGLTQFKFASDGTEHGRGFEICANTNVSAPPVVPCEGDASNVTASASGWTILTGDNHCRLTMGSAGEVCVQDTCGEYSADEECTFSYNGSATMERAEWQLEGTFVHDCTYDFLQVNNDTRYCGDVNQSEAFPESLQVSGVTTFKFKVDGSVHDLGFKICANVTATSNASNGSTSASSNASSSVIPAPEPTPASFRRPNQHQRVDISPELSVSSGADIPAPEPTMFGVDIIFAPTVEINKTIFTETSRAFAALLKYRWNGVLRAQQDHQPLVHGTTSSGRVLPTLPSRQPQHRPQHRQFPVISGMRRQTDPHTAFRRRLSPLSVRSDPLGFLRALGPLSADEADAPVQGLRRSPQLHGQQSYIEPNPNPIQQISVTGQNASAKSINLVVNASAVSIDAIWASLHQDASSFSNSSEFISLFVEVLNSGSYGVKRRLANGTLTTLDVESVLSVSPECPPCKFCSGGNISDYGTLFCGFTAIPQRGTCFSIKSCAQNKASEECNKCICNKGFDEPEQGCIPNLIPNAEMWQLIQLIAEIVSSVFGITVSFYKVRKYLIQRLRRRHNADMADSSFDLRDKFTMYVLCGTLQDNAETTKEPLYDAVHPSFSEGDEAGGSSDSDDGNYETPRSWPWPS